MPSIQQATKIGIDFFLQALYTNGKGVLIKRSTCNLSRKRPPELGHISRQLQKSFNKSVAKPSQHLPNSQEWEVIDKAKLEFQNHWEKQKQFILCVNALYRVKMLSFYSNYAGRRTATKAFISFFKKKTSMYLSKKRLLHTSCFIIH